jgi:hypothetical protein
MNYVAGGHSYGDTIVTGNSGQNYITVSGASDLIVANGPTALILNLQNVGGFNYTENVSGFGVNEILVCNGQPFNTIGVSSNQMHLYKSTGGYDFYINFSNLSNSNVNSLIPYVYYSATCPF